MYRKPFNLEGALDDFRADAPSAEARRRARNAMVRQPKPSWRLAAVSAAVALLFVPAALRSRNSAASALTFGQALQVSQGAPYVTQTIEKRDAQGHVLSHDEMIWAPGRSVERLFFHDGVPGTEIRRRPGFVFERHIPEVRPGGELWKPYESVFKTTDQVVGTEGKSFFQAQEAMLGSVRRLKPTKSEGGYAWFRLGPGNVWKVEVSTHRIVRTETRDQGAIFVSEFTYPDHIDTSVLDVPPVGALPRFDYDRERAEMGRLSREGDRIATVDGQRVKLVGVFQEVTAPGQPVYVAFEGKGLARIPGFPKGFSTTINSKGPLIVATVVPSSRRVKTLDVEIPVPGTEKYARFEKVQVRPVSYRIRNALRTPAYE